jgi:hypothetical protein
MSEAQVGAQANPRRTQVSRAEPAQCFASPAGCGLSLRFRSA